MDYKYNFSIIIPHKNIPDLLCRCVSSIPRREDVEIIIVDDNSDPNIVDFEHFPCLGEKNVNVFFDKSGRGAGHARNIGLENARGQWLIFADADDFFFYSIRKAMDECLKSDADIIYYKSTNLDCDTYKIGNRRSNITNNSIDKYLIDAENGEHLIRMRHPAPWGKLINANLVHRHGIRFEEIPKANDYKFSYLCGYYASKIEAHDIAIYCITSRANNLTSAQIPGLGIVVAKSEIDYLKFLREHNLYKTPTFVEYENDVFAILLDLKVQDNKAFVDVCIHMSECGYEESEINSKLKYIENGRRKAKIVSKVKKILHI